MSEEANQVREALVEAVAAQKLIEEKLAQAREELAKWEKRLTLIQAATHEAGDSNEMKQEIEGRIGSLKLSIAELETDLMAQGDLEKQLKETLTRLAHSVALPEVPDLSHLKNADETIERLEGKVFESEALADLTSHADEHKVEQEAEDLSLNEELESLKKSMKDKKRK